LVAGGPAGIHRGQLSEPVAFQAVHQPPQAQQPLGAGAVGQPVQVLVGEVLELGHQRAQPGWGAGRGREGVGSGRSIGPRKLSSRSAQAPSASPSRSWSARSWSSATSALSPAGALVEWVFESMAATYQSHTRTQAPTRKCE